MAKFVRIYRTTITKKIIIALYSISIVADNPVRKRKPDKSFGIFTGEFYAEC